MLKLKVKNKPVMQVLEEEIESEQTGPSLKSWVLPYLPKILFYGFFSFTLLAMLILQFSIMVKANRGSILAEMQDGSTTRMKEMPSDYRSKAVIHAHIMGILPILVRMSNKLPVEMGGGPDGGIEVAGVSVKIPKPIYIASWNLTEDGRLPILNAIASQFPKGLWQGEQKLLRIYDLAEPVKTDDGYMVYMTASFYVVGPDGQPKNATTFNREIHLVAVAKPVFKLKPNPVEELVNGLMKDGLMISYIKTRRGES